jgi:hypothetical protein
LAFERHLLRGFQLLFETGTIFGADVGGYLFGVRAHLGQGAIAPAVADVFQLFGGSGINLVLLGGDVHLFRPKMFAQMWVHGLVIG